MRAVVLHRFGPPDELAQSEVPDPIPGPGQALIDAAIANLTFVETQIRAGRPPHPAMAPELPAILGNGIGGDVISVGAEVDRTLVGSRMIASTGGGGGYAERVAVPADALIPVPAAVDLAAAVALLADGRTAIGLIRAADDRRGRGDPPQGEGDSRAGGAPQANVELTRAALAETSAGRLRPVIGQTFTLDRAADAHAAIESRATQGKTLLLVGDGAEG